jgi:hypothetical protein
VVSQRKLERLGVIMIRFDNKHINMHMMEDLRILADVISDLEKKRLNSDKRKTSPWPPSKGEEFSG